MIQQHYGRQGFEEETLEWLRGQRHDLTQLRAEDLHAIDQFHHGGLNATRELAELASPTPETRVVDLGGGIGGPARFLASNFGCSVVVVDLTPEFCRVGAGLTELTGLTDKVSFHNVSATETGLETESFDLAWMQNAGMNIEDREGLYREVRRLLKPGGRFVLQEIYAADGATPQYPTPWATWAEQSFLRSPESVVRLLLDAGFRLLRWEDTTSRDLQAQLRPTNLGPSFLDPKTRELVTTNRNMAEGRLRTGLGLLERLE